MKLKKKWMMVLIFFLIALIYTICVKTIDVGKIGPEGSVVGFQTLNNWFKNTVGYQELFYKISKYLGIIPFLLVAFYGIIGVKQLIEKKTIAKVDKKILYLGIFYVLVGITYLFFEKVIINYRPVILEDVLEASYPSSHTMLAYTICISSLLIQNSYIKNETLQKILKIGTILLLLGLIISRSLSGVHWISDIIGGILISQFLISIYQALIKEENSL
ncbi:MAG: phosphatase PAP2 family protein [Bacilli bacterium]|nr:phosphatase PAP2 family protein [Bacilli bacterium]